MDVHTRSSECCTEYSDVSDNLHYRPTSYIPIRVLGKGAFGEAVLYRKTEDNTLVVWKEVSLSKLDDKGRRDAQNEVDILSQLCHPCIISYYNHFLDGNTLLIEMEYANGGSLYHKLGQQNQLIKEFDVLWILFQIAEALAYLHALKILHRDIKTLNIFMTKSGLAKLGDFGIAKTIEALTTNFDSEEDITHYFLTEQLPGFTEARMNIALQDCMAHMRKITENEGNISLLNILKHELNIVVILIIILDCDESMARSCVGTPYYMSPEMMKGSPYSYKSDVWALGCVLFEILSLHRAFDATNPLKLSHYIVHKDSQPIDATYSMTMQNLVTKLLAKNIDDRPTAAQIIEDPVFLHNNCCIDSFHKEVKRLHLSTNQVKRPNSAESCSHGVDNCNHQVQPVITAKSTEVFHWGAGRSLPGKVSQFEQERAAIKVSVGAKHMAVITVEKELYTWSGVSAAGVVSGELGHENQSSQRTPKRVESLIGTAISDVGCGEDFTIILTENGEVFSCGSNYSGCLGMGESCEDLCRPTVIPFFLDVKKAVMKLSVGKQHVICLTGLGEVYSWGSGECGRLGLSDGEQDHATPQKVVLKLEQNIIDIFAGPDCSFLITEGYKVLACGSNEHNKLAFNNSVSGLGKKQKEISYDIPCIQEFSIVKPLSRYQIYSISSSETHSAALDIFNELYTFGSNRYGQLGRGNYKPHPGVLRSHKQLMGKKISHVCCGSGFTVAATFDNEIYSWGCGENGRLGFDLGNLGSGPKSVCVPSPRAIFGALHLTAGLSACNWQVLLIAERLLNKRMVQSTSSRSLISDLQNDSRSQLLSNASKAIETELVKNDSFVPDWLKEEFNNADVIPLFEFPDSPDTTAASTNSPESHIKKDKNPADAVNIQEVRCECGLKEIVERLHARIEELERVNAMLRDKINS